MLNHVSLPNSRRTFGQKLSDKIAELGGSWGFIIFLTCILILWMALNVSGILFFNWDPYPFILLNLFLSQISTKDIQKVRKNIYRRFNYRT